MEAMERGRGREDGGESKESATSDRRMASEGKSGNNYAREHGGLLHGYRGE